MTVTSAVAPFQVIVKKNRYEITIPTKTKHHEVQSDKTALNGCLCRLGSVDSLKTCSRAKFRPKQLMFCLFLLVTCFFVTKIEVCRMSELCKN